MTYRAIATDFDETIAHDGIVAARTLAALQDLRRAGVRLLLVTGRELPDLCQVFSHTSLFDRIVAENGALIYRPTDGTTRLLAPEPPPALIERLRQQHVPISVGRAIVATGVPHEHAVLTAIHDLGLEWHVIFNKGSVMVLHAGVTKATGLAPALAELDVRPEETIGIGDAENDHAFLAMCGLSVAVANALPSLKQAAGLVTAGPVGDGFVEIATRVLAGDLPPFKGAADEQSLRPRNRGRRAEDTADVKS